VDAMRAILRAQRSPMALTTVLHTGLETGLLFRWWGCHAYACFYQRRFTLILAYLTLCLLLTVPLERDKE